MAESLIHIGRRAPKLDAMTKAIGAAEYAHDLRRPRMLYGKILRSAHAHARILNVDTTHAKRLPGVKAVLTADDIPYIPFGFGKDNVALKRGKVRSFRDEIAAVATVDEDTADEALSLIQVEYEPLPAVFDPEAAMQPDAPLVYEERGTNIFKRYTFTHGDVEDAFARAAVVIENRFRLPFVTHTCLEPSIVIAEFDARGNLTVWSPTQIPHLLQRELAAALDLPGNRVRIVQPTIGGAFGSKLDMYPFEPIAALLARATGRPVRIAFTREEEFIGSPTRQPVIADIKMGAAKDGRLVARQARFVLDNGAYTSWGATTPMIMMQTVSSLYRVPNVSFEATVVYTNNPYSGAMRGYGNPQPTFIVESQMDMLAEELGMDPLDFRLLNANQPGDVTPQGMRITTCGFRECLERAAAGIGWRGKRKTAQIRAKETGTLRRGVGISGVLHVGGGARIYRSDGCGAIVKIDDFGRVTLVSGATDMGQGTDVMLAHITAETLGVRPEDEIGRAHV
jgi:xanthine dehydrogenase molybdenum-binding subunit